MLYRSSGRTARRAAVSGVVSVPKGKKPKGGWPVISYDHGTTGIADVCAPSRDSDDNGASQLVRLPAAQPLAEGGLALVRTDYQGLGTPGDHQYLGGPDEGRGTLDIVRAAPQGRGALIASASRSRGTRRAATPRSGAPRSRRSTRRT